MTEEMAQQDRQRPESDPNKRFDLDWDPTHVWITAFADNAKDGTFKLEGGAQAEVDVTQLSKRLQASAYFNRRLAGSRRSASPTATPGVNYYKFMITGKVAY